MTTALAVERDIMDTIPAYRHVYGKLRAAIKDGSYAPGSLLPTENELCEIYEVSRTTVRKAVGMLVAEGHLKVKQGRGTEVLNASTSQRLNLMSSVTETLMDKGFKVTTQGMCIDRVPAIGGVAEALELQEGESVYRLQRVQCADGEPIAIMLNYLRENLVPGFDQHVNAFTSLYSFLESQYHLVFRDAIEYLSAVSADFADSQILKIPFGAPLLFSRRISRTDTGPFEYASTKLVAGKYEYSVYLQGR